jgi:DMSO/TMAO reductase YedYZ molybdopterin-dependent catalytic subunit
MLTRNVKVETPADTGEEYGRRTFSRRWFINRSSLVAMAAALGISLPFSRNLRARLIPAVHAAEGSPGKVPGKENLVVLSDRPFNAEPPVHLLDERVTSAANMFVRDNGLPPQNIDANNWRLDIAGESCLRPTSFSIAELKSRFDPVSLQLQIECGGNGRFEFNPATSGNQWGYGAVACPEFTGVRLKDVLEFCGIAADAVYIGYYAADSHLSGDESLDAISRGVPIAKALEPESLIAWEMNGDPIPIPNGYPLRLVCAGWPGSVSGKWLTRIVVRNQVHDGEKMKAPSYTMPLYPVAPGSQVPNSDMRIIEAMPVKSLITFPKSGEVHNLGNPLSIRGHAWAGDLKVKELWVSIDFGATWQRARLEEPVNRLAWQHWQAQIQFPHIGYFEIWARAVDEHDVSQPMVIPDWNPQGYLNNACHRIAVQCVS